MSRTFHHRSGRKGDRPIRVRGVRKETPDLRRIARALIAMAELAQAESEAQSQHLRDSGNKNTKRTEASPDPKRDPKGDRS
jgi:hypothetical protein